MLVNLLSSVCCCIVSRWDHEQYNSSWYRRNMQRMRKQNAAREKINKEIDIVHLI